MTTADNCSASERQSHEWSLAICMVLDRLPPVFACIPVDWFEDQETRAIWSAALDGHIGIDVLEQAKVRLGFRSLRTMLDTLSGTFLCNARWHAHNVWRNYRRRDTFKRYPGWLRSLEAGSYPDPPVLWSNWEEEAIDCAPVAIARTALLSERRLQMPWVQTNIWWLLSARIDERAGPQDR